MPSRRARPLLPKEITDALRARFWAKVDKGSGDGCWLWTASTTAGYGNFGISGGRTAPAHRVAWIMANQRPIPDGHFVLQRCGVRPCVRADHLYLADDIRRTVTPLAERFQRHVSAKPTKMGCLVWTGSKDENGYGTFAVGQRRVKRAHVVAWFLTHGWWPTPPDQQVLHRCDVRPCVNPEHLFLGDHAANMRDMAEKGRTAGGKKTHCIRGHPLSGSNLIRVQRKDGGWSRTCRECRRFYDRKHKPRTGRRLTGENNPSAVLTAADVLAIRSQYPSSTIAALARQYSVSEGAIASIVKRRTWRHI